MSYVQAVQKNITAAKRVGIVLVVIGFFALLAPLAAGISISLLIGGLLVVGGISVISLVIKSGPATGRLLIGLFGILGVVTGIYMITQPLAALGTLTLFLAGYLIATGLIQVFGAFGARSSHGWGWVLLSGIASLFLGLLIWLQFPVSGIWAIGTLIGIQLLFSGTSLIAISNAAKKAAAITI